MKFTEKSSNKMKIYLLVTSLVMTALSTPTLANFLSVSQNPAPVVAKSKPAVVAVAKPLAKKKAKKVTKKAKVAKDSLAIDIDPTQASSPLYENNKNLELN